LPALDLKRQIRFSTMAARFGLAGGPYPTELPQNGGLKTATPTIIVPIATSKTNTCQLNLPWFTQRTEYGPVPATFEPLVNGECAFGAVYDAILEAKSSVEIICWGFQPSMYFKRGDTSSLCIGQLLGVMAASSGLGPGSAHG